MCGLKNVALTGAALKGNISCINIGAFFFVKVQQIHAHGLAYTVAGPTSI